MNNLCQPGLVSCIIIFLNEEAYLREAIESVFAQTYDRWELIFVDDGSTDGSYDIAREYARQHPEKIQYFTHPEQQNHGMSASRNMGLKYAKGEYVAFLDGDDVWLPEKLEQQVSILERYPEAAMVYGRVQLWYSWIGDSVDKDGDHFADLGTEPNRLLTSAELLKLFLTENIQRPTQFTMLRREIFDQVGYFRDSVRGMFEDMYLFFKVAANAPAYISDSYWGRYRQHPQSCCSNISRTEFFKKKLVLINWLDNYLRSCGIDDDQVWKMIRKKQFWHRYPFSYFLSFEQVFKKFFLRLLKFGRRVIPKPQRDWLWKKIGYKLHNIVFRKNEKLVDL